MAKGADKRRAEQAQTASWGNLNKVFDFGTETAKAAGDKGFGVQDEATKYFQSLLGTSDLGEMLSAPAVNATRDAADAQKREQAFMGTGRSGGAVAANQERESDVMGQISSLLQGGDIAALQLKGHAGEELANIGAQDIQAMLQSLGISTSAAGALGEQSTGYLNEKNRASAQKWASLISGIADIASVGLIPAAKAIGGGAGGGNSGIH